MICGIILAALISTALDAHAGYKSAIAKWTRSDNIYAFETMDARLLWKATLLSSDLLDAQDQLLLRKKLEPQGIIGKKNTGGVGFFVSLYTQKDLKDFSLDGSSTWKIFLVGADGAEVPAAKIEPVTITPVEKVFYPYLTRWSKAYSISFPSVELGNSPKLVLRSIVAESVLKWKIKQ